MYLIVVGAEAESRRLIELAIAQKHEVTLIEANDDKARRVLSESNVRVLKGDIAEANILQEAEVERADAVIAATHDDAQNLMAMMLARECDVETRISLVNERSHITLFESLGTQVISDPAGIIARKLYGQLPQQDE